MSRTSEDVLRSSSFGSHAFARVAAVALTATLAQPAAVLAQFGSGGGSGEPIIRVGFGGGVSVPVSDAKDTFKNGVNGAGFVLLNVVGSGLPALRFAFTYDRFSLKPNIANAGVGSTSTIDPGTSQIFGATGGVKIHLVPGPVRPFVTAGVGAFDVHQALNLTTGGQSTSSKLNFGVDGGGGIEVKLGRLSAFAEGRIQNIFTPNSTSVNKSSIQSIPLTFGILF